VFIVIIPLFAQNGSDTLYCEEVNVESMEEYQELLDFGCSLGCAIGWDFDATSYLEPQGDNTYDALNMMDADLSTAWVEGAEGYGVGESIMIFFEMPEEMENLNFDGIDFINGYAKTPTAWEYNSRVKTFKVWQNEEFLFYIRMLDTDWPQRVNFSPDHTVYLNQGDVVYLDIVEIYEGRKYDDTAITEMNLYGAH
jgi:hypothetical protein